MDSDVSVLVAGGGLVGLSVALFLRDQGVDVMLVEQHPGTSTLPRGRGLNLRSMELFRVAGIEDALRSAPPSVLVDLPEIAKADTLQGAESFRAGRPAPDAFTDISPTTPLTTDQNDVEPVLRREARRLGADLRFHTRLLDFAQDADGVTVRLLDRDGGSVYRVRADYLVAADGHRSPIRQALGISTSGLGSITHYANIPFEADLTGPLRGRRLALCYLNQPVPDTILAHLDQPQRWILMVPFRPDRTDLRSFTAAHCKDLIRKAVGVPDLNPSIVWELFAEDGSVQTWELAARVANRFRAGRVLLAGDAAHVVPPAGGLGGNVGIQDAHNLAWKLAAVTRGTAHPRLLDTYEAERREVAEMTCEYSVQRQFSRITGQGDGRPGMDPLAVMLGYRYRSAAVCAEEGTTAVPSRRFDGEPGSRAPHVPVRAGGVPSSTIDLYRRAFVLTVGAAGKVWADAGLRLRGRYGLEVHRVGGELEDVEGAWAAAHGVTDAGAVLVRPDGFVCWRTADDLVSDPVQTLDAVLCGTLGADDADDIQPRV